MSTDATVAPLGVVLSYTNSELDKLFSAELLNSARAVDCLNRMVPDQ